MPHDTDGVELKAGDRVIIECVVDTVMAGAEYCNVNLKTVAPMPPYTDGTLIVLNTRQVRRVG